MIKNGDLSMHVDGLAYASQALRESLSRVTMTDAEKQKAILDSLRCVAANICLVFELFGGCPFPDDSPRDTIADLDVPAEMQNLLRQALADLQLSDA